MNEEEQLTESNNKKYSNDDLRNIPPSGNTFRGMFNAVFNLSSSYVHMILFNAVFNLSSSYVHMILFNAVFNLSSSYVHMILFFLNGTAVQWATFASLVDFSQSALFMTSPSSFKFWIY